MENLTIKQKEFLKELKSLFIKYNACISLTCAECSDTYGLYDDHLYIKMHGQTDIDFYSLSINTLEIDDILAR